MKQKQVIERCVHIAKIKVKVEMLAIRQTPDLYGSNLLCWQAFNPLSSAID